MDCRWKRVGCGSYYLVFALVLVGVAALRDAGFAFVIQMLVALVGFSFSLFGHGLFQC